MGAGKLISPGCWRASASIGELLALAGSADVVDAHVALMTAPADLVLTSDPGDIRKLLQARKVPARVQRV